MLPDERIRHHGNCVFNTSTKQLLRNIADVKSGRSKSYRIREFVVILYLLVKSEAAPIKSC